MSSSTIHFEIKNAVGIIRLNRPDVLNSFNREMALAMQAALDQCASDSFVRAVFITGNGRSFSAGQDLAEVTSDNPPSFHTILSEHYNPIVLKMRRMEKPVVAFVNGVAAGAGANIALAADVVFAAPSASFIQAFSKIGLIPDSGGTFTLPRLIGWQRASALMMLGDKVSAEEALQMGMIYKTCEISENVEETAAFRCAVQLSQMPTVGLGLTKRALNASASNTFEQQLDAEEKIQSLAGTTSDYNEGVAAFMEKRKPEFKGN